MIKAVSARFCLLPFVALVILWIVQGTSWAQQAPAELSPEKARQFLDLFSDPEVKAWLESKVPAPTEAPGGSAADAISSWETAVRRSHRRTSGCHSSHTGGTGQCGRRRIARCERRPARAGDRHPGSADRRRFRRRVARPKGARAGAEANRGRRCRAGDVGGDRCFVDLRAGQRRLVPGIRMAAIAAQDHPDAAPGLHRVPRRSVNRPISAGLRRRQTAPPTSRHGFSTAIQHLASGFAGSASWPVFCCSAGPSSVSCPA